MLHGCHELLYVGQLAFFKAPHILAEVITSLLSRHPTLCMTWVCKRGASCSRNPLGCEDVRNRVSFRNWMSQDDLIDVLDEHGIFSVPIFF